MDGEAVHGNIVERRLDGSRDDYDSLGRPCVTGELVLNNDLLWMEWGPATGTGCT